MLSGTVSQVANLYARQQPFSIRWPPEFSLITWRNINDPTAANAGGFV